MTKSSFKAGTIIEIDRRPYKLVRMIGLSRWQLEDCRTREILERSFKELQSLYAGPDRRLFFIKELNQHSQSDPRRLIDKIPDEAKIRRAYVLKTRDLPCTKSRMLPAIEQLWRKLKQPESAPNPVTVMRWRKRYLESGEDIMSLIGNEEKRGNRKSRFPVEVLRIVDETIESKFLTLERRTVADTVEYARKTVMDENKLRPSAMQLQLPTRRLVTARIQLISAYDRSVARYGKTATDNKFRAVVGHRTTKLPLERAEIDHTPIDMLVVDDDTFVPMGRPYLTACIDDNTRSVLGFHIGFQPPSFQSVARCLKHAFMPKPDLSKLYPSVQNEWLQHGVMRELVVDNGAEFHSEALELACGRLGIEIHYAPRKSGKFKGKIERFLGTLNRSLAHSSPGTTFSNIFEKDDYDPVKQAIVRYSKFKEIVHIWINDYYHQKPHRGLDGASPALVWAKSIDPVDIPLPDNPEQLDVIMGRPEKRRLSHSGIELDRLFYNSLELNDFRRQHGEKLEVDIRVDDENLGSIYVLSPGHTQVIKVNALRAEYAEGLTRWQHKICRRFANKYLERDVSEAWLEAKQRISDIIAAELGAKRGMKKKISTQAARFKENRFPGPPAKNEVSARGSELIRDSNQVALPNLSLDPKKTPECSSVDAAQPNKVRKQFKPMYRDRSELDLKEDE